MKISPGLIAQPFAALIVLLTLFCERPVSAGEAVSQDLRIPEPGDHSLLVLSPTLLELVFINTKQPNPNTLNNWDWVNAANEFAPPDLSGIQVVVNGAITNQIVGVGFKRRPIYAPLSGWDLRIANHLYLQLNDPISENQSVEVINDGTLWATNLTFATITEPLRYSPAIHVNQEGYLPSFPKKAMIGYYLGSLGEMPFHTNRFLLVETRSGAIVHEGTLTLRQDSGYTYTPAPYQDVREADFSQFATPGEYRLVVPGTGASLPFRIDEGIGMNFARTYALGMFHQRSGFNVAMPFTRFTHGADHLAPAIVPVNDLPPFEFTWTTISNYASFENLDNPPQIAPRLTSPAAQLYPFVNPGPVDVSGGHFEAANYSKPVWNSAQLIHIMMFAVDALPGVGSIDNLGIPESGDGISDVLQEAKWEADCLVKMQDSDGGFYYMIHPVEREYEYDALPENGDPQIVWPKNTATTAAAVAALVQCASSPAFKSAYPDAAINYMNHAMLGWQFLTNALATHGDAGAYQRIMHFDDAFTHNDDIAWAACELYLATGDPQYHALLQSRFPDPNDPGTMRWGWWKMYASYGNTIRSYSAAARSGRLSTNQIDASYFEACVQALTDCADDHLQWSQDNAYGSSFPEETKRVWGAGWYYSTEQAFDIVVAYQFDPRPEYLDAILQNINFETGCNPVNVSYLTGTGWKRQREVVDQYSANDRRHLPKIGVPIGNIQIGFVSTYVYGGELTALTFPSDESDVAPYPFYDRWSDFWNVSTEASTANTVRSFATTLWLAAQTSFTNQSWTSTHAAIMAPLIPQLPGHPLAITLNVADTNLDGAKIIWEARGQEPRFGGTNYTFTPTAHEGWHWIEAEVHWPDGRRAFAIREMIISSNAPPELNAAENAGLGEFSFQLKGAPLADYIIQTSTNLTNWESIATNTLPANGILNVVDLPSSTLPQRFYRALKAP